MWESSWPCAVKMIGHFWVFCTLSSPHQESLDWVHVARWAVWTDCWWHFPVRLVYQETFFIKKPFTEIWGWDYLFLPWWFFDWFCVTFIWFHYTPISTISANEKEMMKKCLVFDVGGKHPMGDNPRNQVGSGNLIHIQGTRLRWDSIEVKGRESKPKPIWSLCFWQVTSQL